MRLGVWAEPAVLGSAQRYFGCWLTFEGSIGRYALYHRYNILDLESEVVIETSVNESFSFLPLLCQFKRLRMRFYAHF